MNQDQLFSLALGLVPPWLVDHVAFTVEEKRLDLHITFPAGSRFTCPVCGQEYPVHDTREHAWRHMDFFQHEAYLHARVPRVKCKENGGPSAVCALCSGRIPFYPALRSNSDDSGARDTGIDGFPHAR